MPCSTLHPGSDLGGTFAASSGWRIPDTAAMPMRHSVLALPGRPLPAELRRFFQVWPPSVLFRSALSGPLPLKPKTVRRRW